MQTRSSSTSVRAIALALACSALALVGSAGVADAASQRPADRPAARCASHPEDQRCTTEAPAEPAPEESTQPVADAPAAEPEPAPEPETESTALLEPDAVDDPPVIITGTSEPPPTDECRNLDGVQAHAPDGTYIDAYGNCVEPTDMSAGDGVDAGVEDGGGTTGAGGNGAGAPPLTGGSSGAAGGVSGQSEGATIGGPTAVAGAAAAPDAVSAEAGELAASAAGDLPFSGMSLLVIMALGAASALGGVLLHRARLARRARA